MSCITQIRTRIFKDKNEKRVKKDGKSMAGRTSKNQYFSDKTFSPCRKLQLHLTKLLLCIYAF